MKKKPTDINIRIPEHSNVYRRVWPKKYKKKNVLSRLKMLSVQRTRPFYKWFLKIAFLTVQKFNSININDVKKIIYYSTEYLLVIFLSLSHYLSESLYLSQWEKWKFMCEFLRRFLVFLNFHSFEKNIYIYLFGIVVIHQ